MKRYFKLILFFKEKNMVKSRKIKRKTSRKVSRKRRGSRCPSGCIKRSVKQKVKKSQKRVSRKVSRKKNRVSKRKKIKSTKHHSVKRKISRKHRSYKFRQGDTFKQNSNFRSNAFNLAKILPLFDGYDQSIVKAVKEDIRRNIDLERIKNILVQVADVSLTTIYWNYNTGEIIIDPIITKYGSSLRLANKMRDIRTRVANNWEKFLKSPSLCSRIFCTNDDKKKMQSNLEENKNHAKNLTKALLKEDGLVSYRIAWS